MRRHIVLLLCLVAAFVICVEGVTRFGYGRVSRIRRRVESEHARALAARGAGSILIVGNSLLREGVDVDQLSKQLAPGLAPQRFAVDSTTYEDWNFGLRHLFRNGSRPGAVMLVMSPRHWTTSGTRGDAFAGLMLDRRDLPELAEETKLGRTEASNLLFSTFSSYYANRADLRKWLMGLAIPGMQKLSARLVPPRPAMPPAHEAEALVASRLRALAELCREYGAKFVAVVPPTNSGQDVVDSIVRAGEKAGVDVLAPLPESRFTAADYSDGFHLNEAGRAVFTQALAASTSELLAKQAQADPRPSANASASAQSR